jgi:hypothetical protein
VRAEVAAAQRLLPTLNGGVLRTFDGTLLVRDLQLGARWLPARSDTLVVAVEPGVSLPVGSIGADAGPLPTTSGSVDPTLAADLIVGGTALLMAGVQTRLPVVAGRDGLRQGPFARGDVRGAWRAGAVVPWAGLSLLRQAPHADGRGDLWELAAVAGASLELSENTGLGATVRVPLVSDATRPYTLAPGLSVRQVFGRPAGGEH